ncbi:DUF4194 domain-containing protein [Aliikangiella sp. G2MR2-5]|uniref:DUF4194 domain-containing protein n=1 Tax=Aliikangiella sp. G2MR2-5 TaxID=2788943 RepID=UPI0018AAF615|nr:DUF4194 domain-containing protein [Aliikangiella sp. G2MR2-5]
MKFNEYLSQRLEKLDVSEFEFKELILRLMNYSVIVRAESQTEQLLFDRLVRCRDLVEEYLSVIGIQLLIEPRFEYARVYPPSSEIPGIKEAEDNAWSGSLRQRLSQTETALVLVVRAQYEKALREGKIDEQGYALDSIESITIAMKNLLGRGLPDKITERKKLFLRLRQLRLIEYRSEEAFENGEGWIKIHPMIVTFVSNQAVDAIAPSQSAADQESDAVEEDKVLSDRMDLAEGEV